MRNGSREGRKKVNINIAKSTPSATKLTTSTSASQQKRYPTARNRFLIIKREGGSLTTTALDLWNDITVVLAETYVQTITNKGSVVTLTTMQSIKGASLNSKFSTFLHLILGTVSVHQDSPVTQHQQKLLLAS